uniref:Anoctamin dimerisation domain-containing protein n=1 Tax=Hippocampus comes TaxID=109280 RepID=A0A3Q2XU51_HIPCM
MCLCTHTHTHTHTHTLHISTGFSPHPRRQKGLFVMVFECCSSSRRGPIHRKHRSLCTKQSRKRLPHSSSSSPQDNGEGLHFSDGRRKVDYVLVFHQRRHASVLPGGEAVSIGEVFMELDSGGGNEAAEPADHEIHLIRQEFEANLLEAGLEIERDREVKAHGLSFTRLHAPWPVLCREAEFLKIKVPTKTRYEIKEESAFSSSMSSVWRKLKQPFQPKVPPQDHGPTKFLTHCFSRDKLHLYNVASKDSFFDNATRGRIVYEILRRTVCLALTGQDSSPPTPRPEKTKCGSPSLPDTKKSS